MSTDHRPHPAAPHFDPTWRDDVFDAAAIDLPLALPGPTARNTHAWVEVRPKLREDVFGHQHVYTPYRRETAVVKPSDMTQYYDVVDKDGNTLSAGDQALSVIFPPKAWMTDSGEERCLMYAAAKHATGDVLVGGLGLAVYPQFVFALDRPVTSITIVERDPLIIDLVSQAWLKSRPDHAEKVTIVEGTIEAYLTAAESDRAFDTIYLDTWEDADPRFLAHVNYIIGLAARRSRASGTIRCWGYAPMVDTFVLGVTDLVENDFPWDDFNLDPVLQAFHDWVGEQDPEALSQDAVARAAREVAWTTSRSIETYDRHRCFTSYGRSGFESRLHMGLSQRRKT